MSKAKDLCKYVDVFYGNGEVDHFAEEGLASRWFYIKALCGNTVPHATLPFGKMSVGPYSGGYPTGYGTLYPNSCGGIEKLSNTHTARGFSHLHQSGTGNIQYFYNYAVTTPFYGELESITDYYPITGEEGQPGFYTCFMDDTLCEFTVSGATALHRYTFSQDNGRVAVDFSNNGLNPIFGEYYRGRVTDAELSIRDGRVFFSGVMSGVKLYFCVSFMGEGLKLSLFSDYQESKSTSLALPELTAPFGAVADFSGNVLRVNVTYSTVSFAAALKAQNKVPASFEETADKAYNAWNKRLLAIDITTGDEELTRRFYSAFYHSLVKPCDMTGEQVLGVKGDLVTGLATLWDQYKTLYPLIFTLYPDMGEKLSKALINISRTMKKLPCSFGITNIFPCEEQAKMLGVIALLDAHFAGVRSASPEAIAGVIETELAREDFKDFLENGVFERYTHILDVTDACYTAAAVTGNKKLLTLAENWKNAYDSDGLMSEKSLYYEGDRYTYSFRLHPYMEERIKLAGGRERFIRLLDNFFGFGGDSVKQLTYIGAGKDIAAARHHRFEGFNNECDMETPYAYIYAGRNDRTCEIVHASVADSFLSGPGGLPGNNDSGGLTSCYMWNVLGLFPAAGTGEFLIGSPHVEHAVITLSNGNRLEIEVKGLSSEHYITDSVKLNGADVTSFRIKTEELMKGGKLTVTMR